MSTCTACGASDWHPDVRNCTRPDCELIIARVEKRCSAAGIPTTTPGVSAIARYLDEEGAGNREADRLVGAVERGAVHAPSYRPPELATS